MGVEPKIGVGKTPQIIHFNEFFPYKPSILGYPCFWKHPNLSKGIFSILYCCYLLLMSRKVFSWCFLQRVSIESIAPKRQWEPLYSPTPRTNAFQTAVFWVVYLDVYAGGTSPEFLQHAIFKWLTHQTFGQFTHPHIDFALNSMTFQSNISTSRPKISQKTSTLL